jgi:hypothetical protein
MKSMTTKLLITAAALAIATGVASAQQYRADIPFAFRAGGKMMAPGSYTIQVRESATYMVFLHNYEARQGVVLVPGSHEDGRKDPADGNPSLTFVCGSSRCSLARMWTGPASPALTFPQPRLGKEEQASATEIRLVKVNGD